MALILMIDDEEDACRLVYRLLSDSGHEVKTFTEARGAIEWLRANTPDIALVDLKLRGERGFDVLKFIHENQPRTKSFVITGYPSVESTNDAAGLGIEEYLVKPMDIDELEGRIIRALGLHPCNES